LPFHGIHDHTLDAKNRLTVPSKARAQLANGVTLSVGLGEPCLQIWPQADHAALVQRALAQLVPFSKEERELKRFFYAYTETMELDSAGRVTVPPRLAAHAGIERDVTVVGAGDCLELWNAGSWDTNDSDLITRAAEHIQSIGHPA
jgi:MraZ protein